MSEKSMAARSLERRATVYATRKRADGSCFKVDVWLFGEEELIAEVCLLLCQFRA